MSAVVSSSCFSFLSGDVTSLPPFGVGCVLEQFIEELSIMDHGLAQVFRAGFSAAVAKRDGMRSAIVLNDGWVVDGDQVRLALKIRHRVSARAHHFRDQAIGFGYRH